MEFDFSDKGTEELFSDLFCVAKSKNLMQKKVGATLAVAIKKRCNQLKAASTLAAFAKTGLGKPHSLEGAEFKNCIGISITGNVRLVIQPVPPDLSAEALSACEKIKIIGVLDYHGRKENWLVP